MRPQVGQSITAPFLSSPAEVKTFESRSGYYLLEVVLDDDHHTFKPLRITEDQLARIEVLDRRAVDLAEKTEDFFSLIEAHRVFQIAFDQRISGAQIGMANAARAFTSVRSAGIQRFAIAADAIPRSLFEDLVPAKGTPLAWNGFTVFGYERDTLRVEFGALSIPAAHLLDPAERWMVVHEVGHGFVEIMELMERPRIKSLIERVYATCGDQPLFEGAHTPVTEKVVRNWIHELVAEVFDFQLGFGRDWKLYVSVSWHFLQDFLEGRSGFEKFVEYLLRYAFVYFYHLEAESAVRENESVEEAIARGRELEGQVHSHREQEAHYAEGRGDSRRQYSISSLCQVHLSGRFDS